LSGQRTGTSSSQGLQRQRSGSGRSLPVGMRQERAFLVGIDYRTTRPPRGVTAGVQAARDAATPAARAESEPQFSAEESLEELRDLAISAGAEIVGEVLQRRDRPDPATLIGRGKLEEIAGAAASSSADLILFDHDLTASQQRNIEEVVNARVIDRTQLILDIFATHARTREGQLQVELAQLEYIMPRLTGRGAQMSQLGGGIGTRGPGETQLETDRRKIARRVRHLQQQIENVRGIRSQQRQRRASVPVATVALVGYTNAGKSTLFNALTNAAVLASPRMFATLDPTLRSVSLPSKRKVLLSDTVGFIRNLPHTLVSSFRATLEEVQRSALILHVSDASSPLSAEQEAQVERVLKELEAGNKATIHVKNKVDLLPSKQRDSLRDDTRTVHVSAIKGIGLTTLLDRIDQSLSEDATSRVRLRIPQSEGKALSMLEARARIYRREYKDGAVELEAELPESASRRVKQWIVS
jgi:GTPase